MNPLPAVRHFFEEMPNVRAFWHVVLSIVSIAFRRVIGILQSKCCQRVKTGLEMESEGGHKGGRIESQRSVEDRLKK